MSKMPSRIVGKPLSSWIISQNRWLQLLLAITAVIAVFANVLPLEMQKRIVNDAINLRKFDLLVFYCGIYLAAVMAASALKYLINILQNIIGQRTIADMRRELYAHILTIPLRFYRRTQPGLVVAALTTELATAGDFIGMAIAIPLTNLLMLLAFGGYLLWLNPLLAAVTLSIYPVVLLLVPVLQKRVNIYNRKRVDAGRKLSSRVGESVAGIHEIQANGAFSIESKKFESLVNDLRKLRIIWNLYRFAVKAVNSLFTNFSLRHGEHMALVGFSGSGKSTLSQCLVQLLKYTGGKILLDQKEVSSELSKKDITHNIGFVSQTPFIFEGSLEENLLYARMAMTSGEQTNDMPGLDDRILVLQQTGLFTDVLRFGLNAVLDPERHGDIIEQILNARKIFRKNYRPVFSFSGETRAPDPERARIIQGKSFDCRTRRNIVLSDARIHALSIHSDQHLLWKTQRRIFRCMEKDQYLHPSASDPGRFIGKYH
jgi:ABC-type multidrug transport system fused ATPase/permease subunit